MLALDMQFPRGGEAKTIGVVLYRVVEDRHSRAPERVSCSTEVAV